MKKTIITTFMLISTVSFAATPIDGIYSSVFGGYSYLLNNLNTVVNSQRLNGANYDSGYTAGGNIGYKSNPMRYEGEVSYVNAELKNFRINGTKQTNVRGQNNVILALANVYYDLPALVEPIQPYLGVGIGYSWIKSEFQSAGPNVGSSRYDRSNSAFTYNAATGITFNFAENYALSIGYRYIATNRIKDLGKNFQAHQALVSAIYRFDGQRYT